MKLRQLLAGTLALTLLAMHPAQVVFAEEEAQSQQVTGEPKTAEQLEEEARAKAEAEKKAAYDTLVDTNQLENWPQGPQVYGHSAIVMDMKSGAILYSKKADEKHFPASITKLLTTLVALENADLTDKVTFSQASVDILNWDDAHIGMRPGEEITMKDALHAVLLASANEVSYAVAESVGKTHLNGGYETFINLMNQRAKELGCTDSHWVNPNGLHDEEHYTTAHDMAVIASAVYQEPEFHNIMSSLEYRIPATNLVDEERVFQQNHKMLWPGNYYYSEYCKGGKTGYTDQSGTTLVTMEDNGTLQLAAVVLQDYGVDAYTDTQAMFDYVFDNFKKVPVSQLEEPEELSQVKDMEKEDSYVVIPNDASPEEVECKLQTIDDSKGKLVYTYQGETVGNIEVSLKGHEVKASTTDKDEVSKVKKPKSSVKTIGLIVGGVIAVCVILFGIQCIRYKKQQERLRRMRRRRAAQLRRGRSARRQQEMGQRPRKRR